MDIEKPVRRELINILGQTFCCFEEVTLTLGSGKTVRADVLAVSYKDCQRPLVLAFEVKSHDNSDPGKFKDALFQASKYVGAVVNDARLAELNKTLVDAAVVYPAPTYRWPNTVLNVDPHTYLLTGIAFMAERLNVGCLTRRNTDWEIKFGSNEIWSKNKGWMGEAKCRFRDKDFITAREKANLNKAS